MKKKKLEAKLFDTKKKLKKVKSKLEELTSSATDQNGNGEITQPVAAAASAAAEPAVAKKPGGRSAGK